MSEQTTQASDVCQEQPESVPAQDNGDHNDVNQQQHCNGTTDREADDRPVTLREEYVDRVWEEFVTQFLLGSCHIQKAAIFDLATRRPLAVNGNLRLSPDELEQLLLCLQHHNLAYRNGVTLEGRTFKVHLADGRNGIMARSGVEGCTVCKTHTLLIIGVHDKKGNSRKCNEDVMRLGDFFRKKAV